MINDQQAQHTAAVHGTEPSVEAQAAAEGHGRYLRGLVAEMEADSPRGPRWTREKAHLSPAGELLVELCMAISLGREATVALRVYD